MKNEVKKKMMMREHRSAVRKSPKRDVRLENQHRHSSFTITETFSSPSSATHQATRASHLRGSVSFTTPSVIVGIFPPRCSIFPARASIMSTAKCSLELDSWPLSTMLSLFPDAAHP